VRERAPPAHRPPLGNDPRTVGGGLSGAPRCPRTIRHFEGDALDGYDCAFWDSRYMSQPEPSTGRTSGTEMAVDRSATDGIRTLATLCIATTR